ncbi:ankyrin repeat-containing domain protein [Aspergillus lucknowensis]|uniref:Ankyrin repeat-containing domain protein n=1 Tax=Aspergillus lucknowensis TaxID=176173 RepID=A0ABR4LPE1_9EURO
MQLLDLPNELLKQIGERIEQERDINAFAQTNRLLYQVANSHLYRTNARNSAGSALLWAAKEGRESTAQLCINHGADVHTTVSTRPIDEDGLGPLLLAVTEDHSSVVNLLLAQPGVSPNAYLSRGRTLLSYAAECGSIGVLGLLLSRDDVDPDLKDGGGATPLWRAADRARPDAVKLLLATGRVDVNFCKEVADESWAEARTPLLAAEWQLRCIFDSGSIDGTTMEDCEETVRLLLSCEEVRFDMTADWRARDMGSLLWHTAQVGPTDILELLLKRGGVNCDDFECNRQTLLSWAAYQGQDEAVRILTKYGAKIDSRDGTGRTPLSWAAGQWQTKAVKCLLDAGAEVDSKDQNGATPLWFALHNGAEEVVPILLAHGAVMPKLISC